MKYALENGALNYLQELLKDEKYYTERLEDAYVMLNACKNQRNKLEDEKKQLISFLEDKIKKCNKYLKTFEGKEQGDYSVYYYYAERDKKAFQEALDFVNKSGKE